MLGTLHKPDFVSCLKRGMWSLPGDGLGKEKEEGGYFLCGSQSCFELSTILLIESDSKAPPGSTEWTLVPSAIRPVFSLQSEKLTREILYKYMSVHCCLASPNMISDPTSSLHQLAAKGPLVQVRTGGRLMGDKRWRKPQWSNDH